MLCLFFLITNEIVMSIPIIQYLTKRNDVLAGTLSGTLRTGEGRATNQKEIDGLIDQITKEVFKNDADFIKAIFESPDRGKSILKLLRNIGSNIRKGAARGTYLYKLDTDIFKQYQQKIAQIRESGLDLRKDYERFNRSLDAFIARIENGKIDDVAIMEFGKMLEDNAQWSYKNMERYIGKQSVESGRSKLREINKLLGEKFGNQLEREVISDQFSEKTNNLAVKLHKHIERILPKQVTVIEPGGYKGLPHEIRFKEMLAFLPATSTDQFFESYKTILENLEDAAQIYKKTGKPVNLQPLTEWMSQAVKCFPSKVETDIQESYKCISKCIAEISQVTGMPPNFQPLAEWINHKEVGLDLSIFSKEVIFQLAPMLKVIKIRLECNYQSYFDSPISFNSWTLENVWTQKEINTFIERAASQLFKLEIIVSKSVTLPDMPMLRSFSMRGAPLNKLPHCPQLEKLYIMYANHELVYEEYPNLKECYITGSHDVLQDVIQKFQEQVAKNNGIFRYDTH